MKRVVVFVTAIVGPALAVSAVAQGPQAVISLLDDYAAGRHDNAIRRAAAVQDLVAFRIRFLQDTPGWIAADPAQAERRRQAAAAFLLEFTHDRLTSDWGRLND